MTDVGLRHLFTIAALVCLLMTSPKPVQAVELVRVIASLDAATRVNAELVTDRDLVSLRRGGANPVVGSQLDGVLPPGVDVDALSLIEGGGLVFSTSVSFKAAGVAADDEDLVLLDQGVLSVVFDGSFYGLPETADIDAVHVESLDPLDVYYSVDTPTKMGSVVFADDDIVRFDGGTHSIVRLGASLLDDAAPRADVDALVVDPSNNQYVISVDVPIESAPGRTAAEAGDLVLWVNDSLLMFFDASASGLTAKGLDLDAVTLDFAFFADDFEIGDTSMWSLVSP